MLAVGGRDAHTADIPRGMPGSGRFHRDWSARSPPAARPQRYHRSHVHTCATRGHGVMLPSGRQVTRIQQGNRGNVVDIERPESAVPRVTAVDMTPEVKVRCKPSA
jgi:hypothetical protein